MLKVIARVQAAAGHERVCGADGGCVAECHLHVEIIILLKERIFKDAEDVPSVVIPVFGHELGSNLLQLVGKTIFTGYTEAVLQGCGNSVLMFLPVFPKIQAAGIFPAACVGNIKNVFQPWIIAAGINQSNPLGATADIAPHPLVPKVVVSAGCRFGLLSENHKLLMERIFVQASHRFQKRRPLSETPCNLLCGTVCHLRVKIQFTRHPHPPHHQNRDTAPVSHSPNQTWRRASRW